jgi:hypothetical protein
MYHAPGGDRVFTDSFANLLRAAMEAMCDAIDTAPDPDLERLALCVPVYDRLTAGQKLVMLRRVGRALFREAEPAPKRTAVAEGTVAAMFNMLLVLIQVEKEANDNWNRDSIAKMVIDAAWEQAVLTLVPELNLVELDDFEFYGGLHLHLEHEWTASAGHAEGGCDHVAMLHGLKRFVLHEEDILVDVSDDVPDDPRESNLDALVEEIRELARRPYATKIVV